MKKINFYQILILLLCIIDENYLEAQSLSPCDKNVKTNYFGVEINNVLCGFSIDQYCIGVLDGKEVLYESSDVTLKLSLLGSGVDAGFHVVYALDPLTDRAVKIEYNVLNNQSTVTSISRIVNDTIYFKSSVQGAEKIILAGKDVMVSSQTRYPYLFSDFIKGGITEKKYKVFDPMLGEVTEKIYTRKSDEDLTLRDSIFHASVLEEVDLKTGMKTTLWLDNKDGFNLKSNVAGRQNYYLADKSVSSRIITANMDNVFFVKTNKFIPDMMNLASIKVKAQINTFGENVTTESLNYPGQKFSGTVINNFIDGEFEVKPSRFNEQNAPPFPPRYGNNKELEKYLKPELTIESDDPLIISEAKRITKGSIDSWDAAMRLSKWVSENIAGAVPGGISAINTLKMQEAECGGHSRLLAAFCRSLGIPARLSIGCFYTLKYGGSFGQHAWTEVYMGDAGWIPLDATIGESNYIDAGHIRLGENANFRPVKMEIIDYTLKSDNCKNLNTDKYSTMVGKFMNVDQYRMFSIEKNENGYAINIPGRVVLELNPPNDQGIWYPKLTNEIGLLPVVGFDGKVDKVVMCQNARLKKMSEPELGEENIPDEFKKLEGNYQFPPLKMSLDIRYSEGNLTSQDPYGKLKEGFVFTKKGESWIEKTGKNEIGFIANSVNTITALILTSKVEFLRGEPVSQAIEPVIKEKGINAGLKKYDELKKSRNKEYFFSEQMLHQLGHSLLKENKTKDAIKVFEKNVKEYPNSFLANDALAETYLKNGEKKSALKYFKIAVKLKPDYEYGKKMIEDLKTK